MSTFIQFLKSQFLSGQCFLCKKTADIQLSLCHSCRSQLQKNKYYCNHCAIPLNKKITPSITCGGCQQHLPIFDQVFSPFLYQQGMMQLIPQFKYHAKLYLGKTLAQLFIDEHHRHKINTQQPELIIPVPLHKSRLRYRGFNQAKELADYFSKNMEIPSNDELIQRIKLTKTQKGLTAIERKKNIKNAFAITEKSAASELKNKHIVIIDDVITTGNTVNEVAKILKKSGAKQVDVWTIARA